MSHDRLAIVRLAFGQLFCAKENQFHAPSLLRAVAEAEALSVAKPHRVHSSERIYSGRVLSLRVDEIDHVRGGGTRKVEVVEHAGGVCIIAQPTPREIILVKQHRHAVEQDLWEVPAGMIERGEPALETAKRELLEETGYRAQSFRPLWSIYTVPGYGQERIHFFVAEGLTEGEAQPEADEAFELRIWPVDEAWALVERDQMRDSKTQIALAWARSVR